MIKYMVYNETNEISNIHGYVQCDMSYREIKESAYGRIYNLGRGMRNAEVNLVFGYKYPDGIKLPGEFAIHLKGDKPIHHYRDTVPVDMMFRVLLEPKVYIDNVKRIFALGNYDLYSMENMMLKVIEYTNITWNGNICRYNLGYDELYDTFMMFDKELEKVRDEQYKKLWEEC